MILREREEMDGRCRLMIDFNSLRHDQANLRPLPTSKYIKEGNTSCFHAMKVPGKTSQCG